MRMKIIENFKKKFNSIKKKESTHFKNSDFDLEFISKIQPAGNIIFVWGRRGNKKELAHNLFQGLLFFNNHPVDHIIGEGTDGGGIGMAIMNRLTKASGTHIINMN